MGILLTGQRVESIEHHLYVLTHFQPVEITGEDALVLHLKNMLHQLSGLW